MPTTLCLDFGNSMLKYAVFDDAKLRLAAVLGSEAEIPEIIKQYQPQKSILSSVINHAEETENILSAHTKFHKLSYQSKLPVTSPVSKPETIGADRLALSVAACHLYPKQHNLVIGLGSCITYNFINKFHEFLGGSISPGLEMRFKSLNTFTAKLPLIKPDENFPFIGYDTRTNILSGVILGACKEIDGMIEEYEKKFSNFNVLLTGGNMRFFASHLKREIFADPYLIFKGLYAISEYNG